MRADFYLFNFFFCHVREQYPFEELFFKNANRNFCGESVMVITILNVLSFIKQV